ncbi:UrvD/REP family ATP-dependent DNA helicase [Frondihabitans australicus]|uniref:DNA 3'-5' helicase n=1 Tax=Frondihabitans australicus TaxID=386892 RepID=A0A495IHU7_9MICO|nr:UrvD/REP family ATP-dependent DNA helicase [Frondihabitans australicus]RKR74881.1 superfamily I DNA/RNA helicase [Frondihabitans australicus]
MSVATDNVDRMVAPTSPPPPLDAGQLAVLALGDGESAAVIGAPGSGKTTALVAFVVDRVRRSGWGPSSVLALTPTRQSATRLRDALAAAVGVPTPGPLARTVASLAFDIAGHAARLAGSPPPTLLTGGEQDSVIRDLLAGHLDDGAGPAWPDHLHPAVRALRGFRTELRELLMRATEHGISPDRLRELGRATDRPEWVAAADFAVEYHRVVDGLQANSLDSAELVDYAVAALDRGETAPLVDGLRVVVVDDAQEATESTLALLRALARRGIAIVAFGDPDLATNAFRGGMPDVLGRLGARLGLDSVTTITLERVHRHGEEIRGLVSRVTERIGAAGAGRQHAARSALERPQAADVRLEPILRIQSDTPAHEMAAVARQLRERHLVDGVPWSQMLVVVRSGALVPSVARALQLAEVPTRTPVTGRAVRDEYGARHLLLAASVAVGRDELTAEIAAELLGGPLGGLDSVSLRRLRLALRAEELAGDGRRSSDDLLVEALSGAGRFATVDSRFAARAGRFSASLQAAREAASAGASIEEVLWGLWERSRLAGEWSERARGHGILADEANRHLDGVVALFTSAKRFVERQPSADPTTFLEAMLGADVADDSLAPQTRADSVLVGTPTAAIGVEAEVVVVARLQDGVWPNLRVRGALLAPDSLVEVEAAGSGASTATAPVDRRAAVMSDELRMLALAVSRATRQLVVSCTANDDESPSLFLRLLPRDLPALDVRSPLSLRGLVGHLRHAQVSSTFERDRADAAAGLARLAAEGVVGAWPDEWYGLAEATTDTDLVDLTDPEARVPVSPSAMSSFEECPLHWFIDRYAGGTSSPAAGLGTIIHDVMEHAVDIDPDSLWRAVEARWGELEFESDWIAESEKERARRMTTSLAAYLGDFVADHATLLGAESSFRLEIGPAVVNGKIDRVEQSADGKVTIVDLKTGKYALSMPQAQKDPQLGSYQLALLDGAIDSAPADAVLGGAKLLYVGVRATKKPYDERRQAPFDESAADAFRLRVEEDARGMARRVFAAHIDEHCLNRPGQSCRIHVIGEVTQ